jgi:hypothetical protein
VRPMNDDTAVLNAGPAGEIPGAPEPDDGLARELARAAPRTWWNRGTIVLGAGLLLVGGFAGGLQAQKHWGPAAAPAAGNRAAGGFGGQNRGGYLGGGAAPTAAAAPAAAAEGTTGTVKLVDGTTIYVQTAAGDVVTVKTDGKTSVATAQKIKITKVRAGQSITVRGATGADGTVTATSVTTQPK